MHVIAGRYPSRSGRQQASFPPDGPINVGWEAGVLGERHTLPLTLQANGYVTGMVGKWHIGVPEPLIEFPPDADPNDPEVKEGLRANYQTTLDAIRSCGFDYVASAYGLNHGTGKKPPPRFWLPKALQHHNMEWLTERAVVTDDGFKYIAVRYPPEIQRQVDAGKRFNHWCQPLAGATHTMGADAAYPAYDDQDQLYDLNDDPNERKNLARNPRYRERLEALQKLLREYSADLPHQFAEFTTQ